MEKTSSKIVYFVRHGESVANISNVFQSNDSPLTNNGKSQANLVAKRVAKIPFDVLISSPIARTKQTTDEFIKETGKTPEYNDLFVERVKPKNLAGKSYEDKEAQRLWRDWEKSMHTSGYRAEDGENFDDIVARVDKALKFLEDRKEESIVVVTHGYFLRTIVARVLLKETLTPENFKIFQASILADNTGISAIVYRSGFEEEESWRLWIHNDHSHLG